MSKIVTCSKNEKALTFRTKQLGLSLPFKKGDKYLLTDDQGFDYSTYVNRKDGSTLYCPNKQIPTGFKKRPKLGKSLSVKIVSIKKVK